MRRLICYRDHGDDDDDDSDVDGGDEDDDGCNGDDDDHDVDNGGDDDGDDDHGYHDDQVLINYSLYSSMNRNFDGVLAVMKPSDFESYMRSEMMMQHHAMTSSSSCSSSSSSSSVMERKYSDAFLSVPAVCAYSSKSDTYRSSISSSTSPLSTDTHTPVLSRSSKKSSPVDPLSINAKSSGRDCTSSSSSSSASCSKKEECSSKSNGNGRVLETSSDVLKSMKAVRKKLTTIAELVDRLQ